MPLQYTRPNVVIIGCPGGDVRATLEDERYIRWRCRDRNCPDAIQAKAEGTRAFHIFDLETKECTTEFEAPYRSIRV